MQNGSLVAIVVGHHPRDPQWAYLVPGSVIQTAINSLPPRAGDATGGDSPSTPGIAPGPSLTAADVRKIIAEELAKLPAPAPGITESDVLSMIVANRQPTVTPDQVRQIAREEMTAWRPKLPGRLEQYDETGKLIQSKDFTFGPDDPLVIKLRPYK